MATAAQGAAEGAPMAATVAGAGRTTSQVAACSSLSHGQRRLPAAGFQAARPQPLLAWRCPRGGLAAVVAALVAVATAAATVAVAPLGIGLVASRGYCSGSAHARCRRPLPAPVVVAVARAATAASAAAAPSPAVAALGLDEPRRRVLAPGTKRRIQNRWKLRSADVQMDPYMAAKEERNVWAPLPWPRSQSEVMIDAMSVIRYCWWKIRRQDEDLVVEHDLHQYWPTRMFYAATTIVSEFGKDRPPSPWRPVTAVFDQPNPRKTANGLKIRSWKNLYKQGPRDAAGVTLGWAQTFVDQSAAERYRCDREILWMLEVLTRDYDRRQVLVTGDTRLQSAARRYCTVRHPEWLFKEMKRVGKRGESAVQALLGGPQNLEKAQKMLPVPVQKAFIR